MLTENNVIEILCKWLEKDGYVINQRLTTLQKGYDIVAVKDGITLYVEAKGETSSKKESKRYEKLFTGNQVKTHVGVAILASMKVLSKYDEQKIVAIALPDNKDHRKLIESIAPALKKMELKVFLVKEGSVELI